MTLSSVDLYRYALPLSSPLSLRGKEVSRREGLLVRLGTDSGTLGWGEAAPLPGFSDETLDETIFYARHLTPQLLGETISSGDRLEAKLEALPLTTSCPASLRFAVESAVVHLLAQAQNGTIATVFGRPRDTVSLNALITNPIEEGEEAAASLRDEGYSAVKMKVGQASVEEEADCVRRLQQVLGGNVALRLDANRAWSLDEAIRFAEILDDVPVAYVEEPLADLDGLDQLAAETSLPLALDETTREVEPSVLKDGPSIEAVVLKPMLLGGIVDTLRWASSAEENDCLPVLSASYESGVGLRMLGALAATFPSTPMGLSTYDRLAADVLSPRLRIEGPTIEVEALLSSTHEMDWFLLTPVEESH